MAHRMSAKKSGTLKLISWPLPIGERSALAAALKNSKLPIEDIEAPGRLFWRFETVDNVSAGFGGLELYNGDALLRSIIALPSVRRKDSVLELSRPLRGKQNCAAAAVSGLSPHRRLNSLSGSVTSSATVQPCPQP
jgi:hypothetical protein